MTATLSVFHTTEGEVSTQEMDLLGNFPPTLSWNFLIVNFIVFQGDNP